MAEVHLTIAEDSTGQINRVSSIPEWTSAQDRFLDGDTRRIY